MEPDSVMHSGDSSVLALWGCSEKQPSQGRAGLSPPCRSSKFQEGGMGEKRVQIIV